MPQVTADRVSVVVCTRDRPGMLDRALQALLAALPLTAEVIVVDSGSATPDTARVARERGVRYVRSDVPGLSIARNLGLQTSARDIVIFTDDDCVVAQGFLAPLLEPLASPCVGAATGLLRDIADDTPLTPSQESQTLADVVDGLDAGHGALMAFRRSVIIELGGFDPILGAGRHFGGAEDMDALCRVLHADLKVVRVPSSVVQHVYTRDDAEFMQLNRNYGLGSGAMCSKWRRASRAEGRRLTGRVARRGVARYLRRIRIKRARRGQFAYVSGVLAGMWESRRIPVDGLVYVDVSPPAAVSLAPSPTSAEPESQIRS